MYSKSTFLTGAVFALILGLSNGQAVLAQSFNASKEAELNLRMNAIEDQMRRMNGDVERLSFEIRQLTERFGKFSEDIEFRLRDMGQNGSAPAGTQNSAPPPRGGSGPVQLGPRSDNSFNAPPSSPGAAGPQILGQIPAEAAPEGAQIASLGGEVDAGAPQKGLYERSFDLLHNKDYAGAERGFKTFIQQNPKSDLASNAHYWLGETFYARQQYKDAARFFLNGYKKHPKGRKAPDNLFKLGMSLKKLGQKDQACAALSEAKKRFPKADKSLRAKIQGEIKKSAC